MQAKKNTKIALLGKFVNLHDEEYIARSFEMIGCEVLRVDERYASGQIIEQIDGFGPDIVMWTKLKCPDAKKLRELVRKYVTVCWVFDLYFDYHRENQLKGPAFTADYVFTTDGGHDGNFKKMGINHVCIRQGMYKEECLLFPFKPIEHEIIFVGSDNPLYPERKEMVNILNVSWFGRHDTNEKRGVDLNLLYSKSRIVIGDSFPSPYYWSNRIVETLGRGGFLIHRDVEGLKEEYPYLVTYSTKEDLRKKIEYYQTHEEERRDLIQKNFEWVKNNYTMEKQCQKLLNTINL